MSYSRNSLKTIIQESIVGVVKPRSIDHSSYESHDTGDVHLEGHSFGHPSCDTLGRDSQF